MKYGNWRDGKINVSMNTPEAKMISALLNACVTSDLRLASVSIRVAIDSVMETPTMNRKAGKIVSANVQPSHGECKSCEYESWGEPTLFTTIIEAIAKPRKTSRDLSRSDIGIDMKHEETRCAPNVFCRVTHLWESN